MDGAAWPDPDRGHVEGALVDEFPLVEAGGDGAELLELGKAALGLPTPIPPGGRGTAGTPTPTDGRAAPTPCCSR